MYYKEARGAFVVFDVTRLGSNYREFSVDFEKGIELSKQFSNGRLILTPR